MFACRYIQMVIGQFENVGLDSKILLFTACSWKNPRSDALPTPHACTRNRVVAGSIMRVRSSSIAIGRLWPSDEAEGRPPANHLGRPTDRASSEPCPAQLHRPGTTGRPTDSSAPYKSSGGCSASCNRSSSRSSLSSGARVIAIILAAFSSMGLQCN